MGAYRPELLPLCTVIGLNGGSSPSAPAKDKMRLHEVKSWGIDIGNVIIRNLPIKMRDSLEAKNASPEEILKHLHLVPDALLGVRMLTQHVGPDNVWIISKANRLQTAVSKFAFDKLKIHQTTGIRKDQLLFCPDKQDKRVIIQALGLEGHIDDRGEIIESIQGLIKCPIWFAPESEDSAEWLPRIRYSVRVVSSWKQVVDMF